MAMTEPRDTDEVPGWDDDREWSQQDAQDVQFIFDRITARMAQQESRTRTGDPGPGDTAPT
jgi:hypothetical protein